MTTLIATNISPWEEAYYLTDSPTLINSPPTKPILPIDYEDDLFNFNLPPPCESSLVSHVIPLSLVDPPIEELSIILEIETQEVELTKRKREEISLKDFDFDDEEEEKPTLSSSTSSSSSSPSRSPSPSPSPSPSSKRPPKKKLKLTPPSSPENKTTSTTTKQKITLNLDVQKNETLSSSTSAQSDSSLVPHSDPNSPQRSSYFSATDSDSDFEIDILSDSETQKSTSSTASSSSPLSSSTSSLSSSSSSSSVAVSRPRRRQAANKNQKPSSTGHDRDEQPTKSKKESPVNERNFVSNEQRKRNEKTFSHVDNVTDLHFAIANLLPKERLHGIIDILRDQVQEDSNGIVLEFDIYELKDSSLMILYDYVNQCLRELSALSSSSSPSSSSPSPSPSSKRNRSKKSTPRKSASTHQDGGGLNDSPHSNQLSSSSSSSKRKSKKSPPPSPAVSNEFSPAPASTASLFPLSGPPRNCLHSSQDVIHIFKREQVLTLQISDDSDEDVDVL